MGITRFGRCRAERRHEPSTLRLRMVKPQPPEPCQWGLAAARTAERHTRGPRALRALNPRATYRAGGGSSNGRTADSDSASLGSNPSPPATPSGALRFSAGGRGLAGPSVERLRQEAEHKASTSGNHDPRKRAAVIRHLVEGQTTRDQRNDKATRVHATPVTRETHTRNTRAMPRFSLERYSRVRRLTQEFPKSTLRTCEAC